MATDKLVDFDHVTDYISREAAIASAISGRIRTLPTSEDGENWIRTAEVRQSLLDVPSAEAEPVKHGRWVPGKEISRTMLGNETIAIDYEDWHCSVCGRRYKEYVLPYRYCPHCGAKMDLGGEAHEQN